MRFRRPRLHEAAYLGPIRCFLTLCTARGNPVFIDPDTVNLAVSHFLQVAAECDLELLAYCFMPDHGHLLVTSAYETADVQRFVHQSKQRSAYEYRRSCGGRLWHPSYFDRILRSDEDTWSVVRYILENPARAGLVDIPRQYPFSGSGVYSLDALLEAAFAPGVEVWSKRKELSRP